MIKSEKGKVIVVIEATGEGEGVARIQKALMLGIEKIGISDGSGFDDHRTAIWALTDLLREFSLDQSHVNVGLGGRPYLEK